MENKILEDISSKLDVISNTLFEILSCLKNDKDNAHKRETLNDLVNLLPVSQNNSSDTTIVTQEQRESREF